MLLYLLETRGYSRVRVEERAELELPRGRGFYPGTSLRIWCGQTFALTSSTDQTRCGVWRGGERPIWITADRLSWGQPDSLEALAYEGRRLSAVAELEWLLRKSWSHKKMNQADLKCSMLDIGNTLQGRRVSTHHHKVHRLNCNMMIQIPNEFCRRLSLLEPFLQHIPRIANIKHIQPEAYRNPIKFMLKSKLLVYKFLKNL